MRGSDPGNKNKGDKNGETEPIPEPAALWPETPKNKHKKHVPNLIPSLVLRLIFNPLSPFLCEVRNKTCLKGPSSGLFSNIPCNNSPQLLFLPVFYDSNSRCPYSFHDSFSPLLSFVVSIAWFLSVCVSHRGCWP